MRTIAAWIALVATSGAFISMLISIWRHQVSAGTGARRNAVEFVWSLIPWVIVTMCAAPSAIALALHGMR